MLEIEGYERTSHEGENGSTGLTERCYPAY